MGLDESLLDKSPFELSGGQKRRVAIAGVIAMEPRVLILDEPSAGLDPAGRRSLLENIRSYHQQKGTTVVMVSHSMDEVAENVDRIIVLADAGVVMSGTPMRCSAGGRAGGGWPQCAPGDPCGHGAAPSGRGDRPRCIHGGGAPEGPVCSERGEAVVLKDITLGQFFPGTSLAHRLDPRTKILLTVVYIVALFCAESFVSYGLMVALLITGVKVSGVAPKALVRGLKRCCLSSVLPQY